MNEQQVRDFLDDYAKVLTDADARAMAKRWHVPALVVGDGRTIVVASREETELFFTRSFGQYHESGVRAAVLAESQVTLLSDSVAAVSVHWMHEDGHGATVGAEDAYYVLAQEPGSADIQVVFYTPILAA